MQKLIINRFGPIEHCELECSHFMVLTGEQASGKSTVAKAIFYFRTIKEDIFELVKVQALKYGHKRTLDDERENLRGASLIKDVIVHLREKFLNTFGSSWGMPNDMYMEYYFTENCFIKVSLMESEEFITPNYLWITFSENVRAFLKTTDKLFQKEIADVEEEVRHLREKLYSIFNDKCSAVYIPAGRSMMTVLSEQLAYIYATMDDMQKRSLDSCTRDYLERILRIKPVFSNGILGLASYWSEKKIVPLQVLNQASELIQKILRGGYHYSNGEERIVLENGKYVKINFSSSGQQESVWILNLLYYYLLQPQKTLFIIEEPESHLFPEAQKYMTELIALVNNCGHSVLVTTHSPYVLGTLNNLLYAGSLPKQYSGKADQVIGKSFWLNNKEFDAWFVKNGVLENCMDLEICMIQNERIDEISKMINIEFEELLELQDTEESKVE